jgi:peptidoglycan/xylan/chitin deacetylase (PgdA/CDA1 family)
VSAARLRTAVKHTIERALVDTGAARWRFRRRRLDRLVLAYHNIVPNDAPAGGDASLHLALGQFVGQLDVLQEWCDVVPLEAVLNAPADTARPQVAVTFDDAYHGATTLGIGEMARRGLPATVFAVPGLIGRQVFWWDAYVNARHGMTPSAFRSLAVEELGGDDRAVTAWAQHRGILPLASHASRRAATLAELGEAVRAHPGLTIGSHSWSHANLARVTGDVLVRELVDSLAWLRERVDRVVPWLSYPYGRWSPAVTQAAGSAGYAAAVVVSGSWMRGPIKNGLAVPRLNVPAGLSIRGFRLRIAGWTGAHGRS